MSLYVLDTDILSLYQRDHPTVSARVHAREAGELVITVISVEEQLTGWYKQLREAKSPPELALAYQSMTDTVTFLARLPVLSFTLPAIHRYQALQALKLNVGKMDLRIAAIALERGAMVVTRNTRDFGRVPGLVIEDWAQ
jgi:tRNA(fMet)-specific endonuclease VapC